MAVETRELAPPLALLALEGAMTHPATGLARALESALEAGCARVVIDCTGMTFLDLTAGMVLNGWRRRLRERGGDLAPFGVAEHLEPLVRGQLPGLRTFRSEAAARASFDAAAPPSAPLVTVRAEERGGARVVSVQGGSARMDDFAPALADLEAELAATRTVPIVLDATRLFKAPTEALARIKVMTTRYAHAGGDLRAVGPQVGQGSVLGAFSTGDIGVFPAYASVDDALAGRAPPAPEPRKRRIGRVEVDERTAPPVVVLAGKVEERDTIVPLVDALERARARGPFVVVDAAELRHVEVIVNALLALYAADALSRGGALLLVLPTKPHNLHSLLQPPSPARTFETRADALAAVATFG